MPHLILADWLLDVRKTLLDFYLFSRLDPGSAFVFLGAALLVGRKVYRHYFGKGSYSLKNITKYPGEMLELAVIALLILVGLFIKAAC